MYLIFLATVLSEMAEVLILPFPSEEEMHHRSQQDPGHKHNQVLILSTISPPDFSLPWSMPLWADFNATSRNKYQLISVCEFLIVTQSHKIKPSKSNS